MLCAPSGGDVGGVRGYLQVSVQVCGPADAPLPMPAAEPEGDGGEGGEGAAAGAGAPPLVLVPPSVRTELHFLVVTVSGTKP